MRWTWVDWVILVVIAVFAARGWMRGILSQLFAVLGVLVGLWVAMWVSQWVGQHWQHARPTVVFLLMRGLVVLLSGLAVASVFQVMGERAREASRDGPLGWADGPVGMVLGAGLGAVFVTVALLGVLLLPWPSQVPAAVANARLSAPLLKGGAEACRHAEALSPGWQWLREKFLHAERRVLEAQIHA